MKINYLKYCTFFVLYLITTTLPAQNYIYNSGFENGNEQSAYNTILTSNTIQYLDNWEKADNKDDHSPDWWRKGAPSLNFQSSNVAITDDTYFYPSSPPYQVYYDAILPHTGYGMAGLHSHELIQQKINSSALEDALDNSSWNSITLKMWVRMANNRIPENGEILKVFLSKSNMEYKEKEFPCSDSDFRTYKSTNRLELLSKPNLGVSYPRGEWHLITKTFDIPSSVSNISAYNWIVIDMNLDYDDCLDVYIFIDDIELTVGCPDKCSATDGTVVPSIPSNFIASNNLFVIDNVQNASSVRLEVYMINGASVVFDETISCTNGIDHPLYWDGILSGGSSLPNATYGYRMETYNDCGQQKFTGTFTKYADYTGTKATNFNIPCSNGVNPTPDPCCWADPNLYINNTTLIGPDPGWSNYIIPLNIWACTDQADFSDWVKVEHDAKVLFRAGSQVTLREGFHVDRGAVFCAEIKPCSRPRDTGGRSSDSNEMEEVVANLELIEYLKVYPNPTTGLVNVDLSYFYVENKTYQLSIYNVLGEKLQSFEVDAPTLTIRLQNHPKGIYLIEVSDGIDQHVIKLIKG